MIDVKRRSHSGARIDDRPGGRYLAIPLGVQKTGCGTEHFQWLTDEASRSLSATDLMKVSEEMADVLLYLIRLADKLNVNLLEAAGRKIGLNAQKYPADKARGNSRKYTEL
jgi:hypothetical protein